MVCYEIDFNLLQIIGPYFIGLCALTVGFKDIIINFFTKPKLVVDFAQDKKEYFHKLLFSPLEEINDPLKSIKYVIRQPGINSRVIVYNRGKRAAKKVLVRLEKISFCDAKNNPCEEILYHPSSVKWSGEKGYGPVDITRDSFFFFDLIYFINETRDEIVKYYENIDKETINRIVGNPENYSGEVFWNVWIDLSYERGVPYKYYYEGKFKLTYVLSAENFEPFKFEVFVEWHKMKWSEPVISLHKIK
jgi:hypothetical protein